MAITECGQGHLYDADQYAACPYCNGGGNVINFGAGPASDIGKTAPVGGGFGPAATPVAEVGSTVAPAGYQEKLEESNKTVAVSIGPSKSANQPVVGWLVCIEGKDQGKDYRLFAKNNTIGRGDKMDVCIKGDNTISRENHARVAYDQKHNNFHLIPGDSTNNIYVNDEPVYVPTKIAAYDCIELGETKVMFVPLCTDAFTWEKGIIKTSNVGE